MSANGRAVVGGDDAASDSLESESMVVVLLSAVFPQCVARCDMPDLCCHRLMRDACLLLGYPRMA